MVILRFPLCVWTLSLFGLIACQLSIERPDGDSVKQEPASRSRPVVAADAPVTIDWTSAADCRDKLWLLRRTLAEKRVETLEDTPFTLIGDDRLAASDFGSTVPPEPYQEKTGQDQAPAVRCVIRLGRAREQTSDHRVLRREQVRSAYQSGSRTEKNPAYEAAKARLKQAERKAKPGKSSIIKVGDPLLDLVGVLVGGALTGLGQWGAGDDLEEALDTLMATPRSIEKPQYQPYHFERAQVRASREATMPIMLTDLLLKQTWRTTLRRREVREFHVLDGLDRQDRDYATHRQTSLAEEDLHRWKTQPPAPPLDEIVAGLIGAPAAASVDRVTWLNNHPPSGIEGVLDGDDHVDAAALPHSPGGLGKAGTMSRASDGGVHREGTGRSVVTLVSAGLRAKGVYVSPSLVLVSSEPIGERGLIDVKNQDGHPVLGLVAALDRGRGLALVQVPMPGQPVTMHTGSAITDRPNDRQGAPGYQASRNQRSWFADRSEGHDDEAAESFPLLAGHRLVTGWSQAGHRLVTGWSQAGHRLVGLKPASGPDIPLDDINAFLNDHRHLILADR